MSSLYHSMLGSGFPFTGHVSVFTIPPATKAVSPLPVASTGSLNNNNNNNKLSRKHLLIGCKKWVLSNEQMKVE